MFFLYIYNLTWQCKLVKANYHLCSQPISDPTSITAVKETSWTKLVYFIASIFSNSAAVSNTDTTVFCRLMTLWGLTFVFPSDTIPVSDLEIIYIYIYIYNAFQISYWMPEALLTSIWNTSLHLNWFVDICFCCLENRRHCWGDILYLYQTTVFYISPKCVRSHWQCMTGRNLTFIKNEALTSINNEGFK